MLSFRSILFAAAAFATLASATAIPSPDSGVSGVTNLLGGVTQGGVVPAGLPAAPVKRGHKSHGDIIKKCHGDVDVRARKIKEHCHGKERKDIDHGIVIELLEEIVEVLKGALYELKLIVKIEFLLDGVACTLKELAELICDLLVLVVDLVYLILSLLGFLDFKLCGIISLIGELLCEILVVVFALVEGLLEIVVELIAPHAEHCRYVHYHGLLEILHIL